METRLGVLVGQLNAIHAQLVDLVAEAAATGAWHGVGVRSLEHWLTWQAGLSRGHASELVRLAAAKASHPVIMGVFADGALTVDQAAVAVRVPAHNDAEVAELAPMAHRRPDPQDRALGPPAGRTGGPGRAGGVGVDLGR